MNSTPDTTVWLTVDAAADLAGRSTRTIRRWLRQGDLPTYRLPASQEIRIRKEDLDALLVPSADVPSRHVPKNEREAVVLRFGQFLRTLSEDQLGILMGEVLGCPDLDPQDEVVLRTIQMETLHLAGK